MRALVVTVLILAFMLDSASTTMQVLHHGRHAWADWASLGLLSYMIIAVLWIARALRLDRERDVPKWTLDPEQIPGFLWGFSCFPAAVGILAEVMGGNTWLAVGELAASVALLGATAHGLRIGKI